MTRPVFSVSLASALLMSLAPALGSVPPSGQEVPMVGTRILQPSSPSAQRLPLETPAARERQLFQSNEISFPLPCDFVRGRHGGGDYIAAQSCPPSGPTGRK